MSTKPKSRKSSPKFPPAIVKAHKGYVDAINSNDVDRVMAMYDKDVVIMQPGIPLVTGRRNVRKWVADYFRTTKTHWIKKALFMVEMGEYGFDQGHDTAVNIPILSRNPLKLGKPSKENDKGILIYKKQKNGEFLVFRDIWNSNDTDSSGG